eukprot:g7939.t1
MSEGKALLRTTPEYNDYFRNTIVYETLFAEGVRAVLCPHRAEYRVATAPGGRPLCSGGNPSVRKPWKPDDDPCIERPPLPSGPAQSPEGANRCRSVISSAFLHRASRLVQSEQPISRTALFGPPTGRGRSINRPRRFRFLFHTPARAAVATDQPPPQAPAEDDEAEGEVDEQDLSVWRAVERLSHGAASFQTSIRSVVSIYVEWVCAARGLKTDDAMLASQLSLCFVVGHWDWSEIRLRLCEVLAQDTDEPLVPVEWTQIPAAGQWEHDARPRRALFSRLAEYVEAELAWDSGRVSKQGCARACVELLLRWHVQNEIVRRHGHEHGTHSHHRLFAAHAGRLAGEVANVAPEAWGPVLSAVLPDTLVPGEHCYAAPGTTMSFVAAALDEAKHARTLRLDPLVSVHLFFYLAWPALLDRHLGTGPGLQLRTAMQPAADQELLSRIFLHRVLAVLRGGRPLQVFAAIDAALKEWQQIWGQRPAAETPGKAPGRKQTAREQKESEEIGPKKRAYGIL